ncbi:hypothetical protein GCM10025879_21460 [Leuconostoc litchii]|uniref:hypothetical protein n=1 Tax=Leuconostoc litchii TaxID=1981069 RepID=UPI0023E97DA0|nr:hypothetical protein [Leuconostoc litchii]GMA70899.1 hypothetical protein GCM10025879_21460 [Leuconostoc litchii]
MVSIAQATGITDIDSQHVPGTSVDNQKQAAKDAIDKEAAKVTEDIKNDPTLSQADKDKQTQAVADAATKAKNISIKLLQLMVSMMPRQLVSLILIANMFLVLLLIIKSKLLKMLLIKKPLR